MTVSITGANTLRFTASAASGFLGAATVLVLVKKQSDTGVAGWFFSGAGATGSFALGVGTTNLATVNNGSTSRAATSLAVSVADGWVCLAVSRPTGTSTPRFHKYVYATGVASHQDATGGVQAAGSALGTTPLVTFAAIGAGANSGPGSYAVGAVFDHEMTDSEFETAALSLASMKSSQPTWGLWSLNQGLTSAEEFFIGSTFSSGAATAIDGEGFAFGYGEPIHEPLTRAIVLDAALSGEGTLSATISLTGDSGPSCAYGWKFIAEKSSGLRVPFYPTITGTLSHDWQREVRRSISGVTLLPDDLRNVSLSGDLVHLYLLLDGEEFPMGIFNFTESARRPDVILDPDTRLSADLLDVSLSDQTVRLRHSTGDAEFIPPGSDPTQEMQRILDERGLPHAIAGSVSSIRDNIVWTGSTKTNAKIDQLATVAGHRPPWADNAGVIRSISALVVETDIIDLAAEFTIQANTVAIQENYLSAPNRIIVTDTGANGFPIRGQWDAPASAPHSAANRGWVLTEEVQTQGLSGSAHAEAVARTIGEQYTARKLSFALARATDRFDGPVVLSYRDALWLVTDWSVSLAANTQMGVNAVELIPDDQ